MMSRRTYQDILAEYRARAQARQAQPVLPTRPAPEVESTPPPLSEPEPSKDAAPQHSNTLRGPCRVFIIDGQREPYPSDWDCFFG